MAGIYVHIPFCHSKCIYCDFFSTPNLTDADLLIEALIKEYHRRAAELTDKVETLYLGGGTPSIIAPDRLARLCKALPLDDVREFTIEANPEDVNQTSVRAWRDMGVNRVSMGIQSFDDTQLRAIGRRHSAEDARRAINCLLDGGISNISCDLIYGLPDQTIQSWERSLTELLSYRLPHISAYCLSYEPGTALYAKMTAGKIEPADDSVLDRMYKVLCKAAASAGYEHYEISNFALPGMRSRHNSSYWNETPYLGLGPGAHSFDGVVRRYNTIDLKTYVKTADITVIDEETGDQLFNDKLITALRTSDGLDVSTLPADRADYIIKACSSFISNGSMTITDSRLRINEDFWLRADAILRELIVV